MSLNPFLKWPGGKRWFVENYSHLLPTTYNCYFEPFLGAGSVFFHLQPEKAFLGDVNSDVIAAYKAIKSNWKSLKRSLHYHQKNHSTEYYYKVRQSLKQSPLQIASRMIYLNRTCFNGIYRVNLAGQFNVPIGTKGRVLLESDDFENMAALLRKASLRVIDFESLIDKAAKNDLIFADPPYTVRHNLNGFVKYNETLFTWEDQERLALALIRAKKRGAKIVLTNANHISIRKLYSSSGFYFQKVSRFSSIAASKEHRSQFEELVIMSHPTT